MTHYIGRRDSCVWTYARDEYGNAMYKTECSHVHQLNHQTFCPYCSGVIEIDAPDDKEKPSANTPLA